MLTLVLEKNYSFPGDTTTIEIDLKKRKRERKRRNRVENLLLKKRSKGTNNYGDSATGGKRSVPSSFVKCYLVRVCPNSID